jgi:single-stranded-DNA-specific exonuclease
MSPWPASPEALARARDLVCAPLAGRCVIACDRDVDGLTAAVLSKHAMERRGSRPVDIVPAARGEHVHHPPMRARLRDRRPALLLVVDMGSRGAPILRGVPTVIIDHHQPAGWPPDAIAVSAYGYEPVVAPTSLLAFELFRPLVRLDDLAWLAALGTVADTQPPRHRP